jgi:hypothetical protein
LRYVRREMHPLAGARIRQMLTPSILAMLNRPERVRLQTVPTRKHRLHRSFQRCYDDPYLPRDQMEGLVVHVVHDPRVHA